MSLGITVILKLKRKKRNKIIFHKNLFFVARIDKLGGFEKLERYKYVNY